MIFIDEIQESPKALSALKVFATDGRFKVIASGSMLGVASLPGEHQDGALSPMGYVRPLEMHSLDFEEFLWACGIGREVIAYIRNCIKDRTPLDGPVLNRIGELFRLFQVVGGMPA